MPKIIINLTVRTTYAVSGHTGKSVLRNNAGLTLIELVIVIIMVGIAIAPITSMLLQGVRSSNITSSISTASGLAQEKMEETLSLAYSAVTSSSGSFS
ncbi:MAG: prepilin-type N-terminal cleavage/methylation domain-containing protein, partial [Deltaproteobacteria bacterium]|nr:prepilin-type N-terminal cleavage/methylation domain-containing protein [Deltaproteobacteria bacterium]